MEFRHATLEDIDKKYSELYPFNAVARGEFVKQINAATNESDRDLYILEDLATYEIIGSSTVEYDEPSGTVRVREIRVKKKYRCCGIEQYILRKTLTASKDKGYSKLTVQDDEKYEFAFKKFNFVRNASDGLMICNLDAIETIKRSPKRPKLDITMEIGPIFPN